MLGFVTSNGNFLVVPRALVGRGIFLGASMITFDCVCFGNKDVVAAIIIVIMSAMIYDQCRDKSWNR